MPYLFNNLPTGSALLPSPHIGNNTKRTEMVTSLHDGHIGFHLGKGALGVREFSDISILHQNLFRRLFLPCFNFLEQLWEQGDGMGPDDHIQIGNPIQESVPFLLGNASCHSNDRSLLLFQSS